MPPDVRKNRPVPHSRQVSLGVAYAKGVNRMKIVNAASRTKPPYTNLPYINSAGRIPRHINRVIKEFMNSKAALPVHLGAPDSRDTLPPPSQVSPRVTRLHMRMRVNHQQCERDTMLFFERGNDTYDS